MRRAELSRRVAVAVVLACGLAGLLHAAACSSDNAAAPPDASVTADAAPDPCAATCASSSQTCTELDVDLCTSACTTRTIQGADAAVSRDVLACLKAAAADCTAVSDCFRPPPNPPSTPFAAGPYGTHPKDVAGPFTITTTTGEWDFKREWTGDDSHVFLMFAPGEVVYPSGDYSDGLFQPSLAKQLLAKSAPNVHYFFLPLRKTSAAWETLKTRWTAEIPAAWASRVHFVDTPAVDQKSWIGEMMRARVQTALPYKQYDTMGFAIDRSQRIREVGMLGTLAGNGIIPQLSFLANEATYFNFEWTREKNVARPATVITLSSKRTVHDTFDVDVTLPDAATMATMDTLETDLVTDCPNHRDGECGAWDYLSHLWVCDPAVAPDGGAPTWQCTTEIARWITSYWREGRWVTDISGMLPHLKKGGSTHFRWYASGQFDPRRTDYDVSLAIRLSSRGKGMKPTDAIPLWTGGNWNAGYDAAHQPKQVPVPAGAKKVELYTLITGHGGSSNGNCAEFCNHEHRFAVNGKPHLRSFPGAQTANGCSNDVGKGVVPNQHGTWYFGRGGWCPGQDVAPYIVDVTSEIKPGQSNDLAYTTTFGGLPVDVGRGNIVLSSYLVVWQ